MLMAHSAYAKSTELPRWCGGRLTTSGDKWEKGEIKVSLFGRLVLKSFPSWKDESKPDDREWILLLDYQTPVLSDIAGKSAGDWITVSEVQLYDYRDNFRRFRNLQNKHVRVIGVLNTGLWSWHRTDVYVDVRRIVPFGSVACNGKPLARH
jgi:hypothetical protein